jgi:hypothetical protein
MRARVNRFITVVPITAEGPRIPDSKMVTAATVVITILGRPIV